MFDVRINYEDIEAVSMESQDIIEVENWLKNQHYSNSIYKFINLDEFYDRFMESYVSEEEILVKIVKSGVLIGILKGRIEFKNPNEVWIWCFILDDNYREMGIGSNFINKFMEYFRLKYDINNFYTIVADGSRQSRNFWYKNDFKLFRISEDYFENNGENADMLIFRRV